MNPTRVAIEGNRITLTALALIVAAGIAAFFNLPRAEDPGFTIRVARVTTLFPGASPQRVERLVTDKLEREIQRIEELDYVSSESAAGVSVVNVFVRPEYTNLRPIWDELRRKMRDIRSELPEGAQPPSVDDEFGDVYGIVLAVHGQGFNYAALEQAGKTLRDDFLLLGPVAKVQLHGVQPERLYLDYDNATLNGYGLSPSLLMQALQVTNIVAPGGQWRLGDRRIVVEPSGNYDRIAAIGETLIPLPGGGELALRDVADLRVGYEDPPRTLVRASAQPAVVVAVAMREGGNILDLSRQVQARLKVLNGRLPVGLQVSRIAYQPARVDRAVDQFVSNLGQSVTVVLLVLLVFLGLRTGLVVASLLPMVILATLWLMSLLQIGLDRISLAALIISLGIIVDNGIVMAESILVQLQEGRERLQAAVGSARELAVPLLTSSLTTAVAFLPIYLAEEEVGEYTAPLFKVVAIALGSSWVLAMTVLPLLCHWLLRAGDGDDEPRNPYDSRFYRGYRRLLLGMVRHRWISLLVAAGLFGGAIYGLAQVPNSFFPPSENAFFKVELELPVGTAIEQTAQSVAKLERYLDEEMRALPDGDDNARGVESWASYIGYGGPRYILQHTPEPPKSNYAFLLVNVRNWEHIPAQIDRLERWLRAELPDAIVTLRKIQNGPGLKHPIGIRLLGDEIDVLQAISDQVQDRLRGIEGVYNVDDDWGERTQKLRVRIDQVRARQLGITSRNVADSLRSALSGMTLTEYREDEDLVPILLRSRTGEQMSLADIEAVTIFGDRAERAVPLRDLADLELVWEPALIYRKNRQRNITVTADLRGAVTTRSVIEQLRPWLAQRQAQWPAGYRFEFGGEFEESEDARSAIAAQLPIAGLIIALLLVTQFNSIRRAGIILLTVPLGLIGVTLGLLATQTWFGFMTILGVISLSGIVINNAIVLIDRIGIEQREGGHEAPEAVLQAAQRRLRPILLSAATTALGMLPLWLFGGALFQSMAIAIIFGLLFATLLTLSVVPVLYSLFYGLDYTNRDATPPPAQAGG